MGQYVDVDDRELSGAFEYAPIGMAVADLQGRLRHVNPALTRLLGRRRDELVGSDLFMVTHDEDLDGAHRSCAELQESPDRVSRFECRMLSGDGSLLHVLVCASHVPAAPPGEPYLVMHVEDITERKLLEEKLRIQTLHDPLTGLPNRNLLLDRLTNALLRNARTRACTTLLYLDLNGFKEVNDDYGHDVGDELLVQFADRITRLLRPGDTPARLGGDEFAVLCEDTDSDQAQVIVDRLLTALADPFDLSGTTITTAAAVGVAVARGSDDPPCSAEDLLRQADRHMYSTKRRTGLPRRAVHSP